MSHEQRAPIGAVVWCDLTVPDATGLAAFYQQVVGWTMQAHEMDGYQDFELRSPETGETVAGLCHARAVNAGLPPAWLVYVVVADLDTSVQRCQDLGGELLAGPHELGDQRVCVIRDPAGAALALVGS